MTISAKIIKDSISHSGVRITTFVLKYPRFVHCFDEQTEVLCEIDGYKKFIPWREALKIRPKLANYHKDGTVDFSHPSAWVENEVENEDMVEISSQRISMLVTKGHRLYVGSRKSKKRDEWEVIKAEDMLNEPTQKRFGTFGFYKGGENLGKLANLIGFFIGDGTIMRNSHQVIFHLKKQRKIDYLKRILDELKINYETRPYEDGTTNIVFRDHIDLFRSCYDDNREKVIPKIIHNADSDSYIQFMDGLWNSDGSTDKGYLQVFNTTSKNVADGICTLASIHGMRINFKNSYKNDSDGRHKPLYKLTNCTESQPIIRRDKHPAKVVKYTGKVYCATVDTGLLIVRRNGLVHISGNCEFMTHRDFSRNASSTRAVPIARQIKEIQKDMAMPLEFRSNKPGMQAGEPLSPLKQAACKALWRLSAHITIQITKVMMKLGMHKQYARILEPYSHINVIVTSTRFDNFFALRIHKDAQPEIKALAEAMFKEYSESQPEQMPTGGWHLPYLAPEEIARYATRPHIACKISAARCARVSYLNHDGTMPNIESDLNLYNKLLGSAPVHASPAEHQAQALEDPEARSGNFHGWLQFRKTIENENITNFLELLKKETK